MKKTRKGKYHLIAEWERAEAVALVNPQCFAKYSSPVAENADDYYNSLKIKSINEDFNTIINTLVPLRNVYHGSDVYIITTGNVKPEIQLSVKDDPVKHFTLPGLKDIWIKDFAPLPARGSTRMPVYIKPLYKPAYLSKSEAEIQHKAGCKIAELFNRELVPIPLTWDIGNFTHNGNGTGIVTKRLLKDNPEYTVKEIREIFREIMSIDNLIIINEEPDDITGHVDGTLRFINYDKIAIASYPSFMKSENKYIESVKNTILKYKRDITFIDIPNSILIDSKTDGMYSIFGNHVNFLWLGFHTFVPVYNIPSDAEAYRIINKSIVNALAVPVRISSLSHFGGALNCMTWKVY